MKNKSEFKTLEDFTEGKYSYNDYLKVREWFASARDDFETENELFDQWKKFNDKQDDTKSLRPVFEKIQYQILLEEKQNEQKWSFWKLYRHVAAVLIPFIVISASYYFFFYPKQENLQSWLEINVPSGARVEFMLPDSTTGWLNSGAKLKYPAKFSNHRKVELTGEAFFQVKHHDRSDFTVGIKDMDIRVLGTKFNVSAYGDDAVSEVVLEEGSVEIKGKSADFERLIHPGEKLSFNRNTKSVNKLTVNTKVYTAWTNGYLVIDDEPLLEAAKKLERWYGVEIHIPDNSLKNYRFKATFKEEPLEEVLRFIAMTTPIDYKIETIRNEDTNGTLKKKQVTLKLK